MKEKKFYPGLGYQDLFDYLSHNHGLNLLHSEMSDLIHFVHKFHPQSGAIWVKGAPTERKQHFAKVCSKLDEKVIYDAIIWPAGEKAWYATGNGFNFNVHANEIIAHQCESPAEQPVVNQDAHEKEIMMQAFYKVRRLFEGREWIMEGRGSYPYNDDRYKEEVRYLYDEFDTLQKDTWKNIQTKSFEYRKAIIAEYLAKAPEQPVREVDKEQFDRWHTWLSAGGYTYDGEYYYDEENNYYTTVQLWEIFKKQPPAEWSGEKEVSGKDANEIGRVFINKILLLAAGFEELNKDDYEFFVKDKVEVWDFNGEYWIVDMLDQAGIEKQFQYMDELETLFHSFGLSFYNQQEQQ